MVSFAVEKYRERYGTVGWKENRLYPGITDCLKALKAAGYQIAMATAKPEFYAKKIVAFFELMPYFDVVIGSSMEHSDASKATSHATIAHSRNTERAGCYDWRPQI